jgi:hypothetical protein
MGPLVSELRGHFVHPRDSEAPGAGAFPSGFARCGRRAHQARRPRPRGLPLARAKVVRAVLLLSLLLLAGPAAAQTCTEHIVDRFDDAPRATGIALATCRATGGGCTLRAAIETAGLHAGCDRVVLRAGTYGLTIPDPPAPANASAMERAQWSLRGASGALTLPPRRRRHHDRRPRQREHHHHRPGQRLPRAPARHPERQRERGPRGAGRDSRAQPARRPLCGGLRGGLLIRLLRRPAGQHGGV